MCYMYIMTSALSSESGEVENVCRDIIYFTATVIL